MRILVYGAGVLGCELAHVLLQNKKNDVTCWHAGSGRSASTRRVWSSANGCSAKPRWTGCAPSTSWPRRTSTTLCSWCCRPVNCRMCCPSSRPTGAPTLYSWATTPMQAGSGSYAAPSRQGRLWLPDTAGRRSATGGQCAHRCGHDGGRCHGSAFRHLPHPAQDRL